MKENTNLDDGLIGREEAKTKPVVETTGQRTKARNENINDKRGKFTVI